MKIQKKRMGIMLAVLIIALVFPAVVSAVGQKAGKVGAEAMEITWMFRYEDSWCLQEIEKKFNVDIISNGIWIGDREKVSLMISSGETPDAFNAIEPNSLTLFNERIIRSIPKKMMKENMPGYMKMMDENPLGWFMEKSPEKEEEYLGILGICKITEGPLLYPAFRVDWAKKVGIELPNYEKKKLSLDDTGRVYFLDENKTLDWFEKLLVAFRDGDPDGNGKIDTIPAMGHNGYMWGPVLGAFGLVNPHGGITPNGCMNYEENGKMYLEPISPRYKEFLKLAVKWYKMGLFDTELASLSVPKAWDKVVDKIVGMTFVAEISYVGAAYAMKRPPNSFATDEDVAAGGEVVMLPPPIGQNGVQGCKAHQLVTSLGLNPLMINAGVSDEKLKKILEIFEYTRFDKQGWIYNMYGKPDVHFKWSGEPWESSTVPVKKEEIPEGYPEIGRFTVYPPMYNSAVNKFLLTKKLTRFYADYVLSDWGQNIAVRPYRWDQFEETNMNDVYNTYGEQLNTMIAEFYLGVLTGEIDLDAEWDSYVDRCLKNGGNEVLDEMKKSLIVSELLKGNVAY